MNKCIRCDILVSSINHIVVFRTDCGIHGHILCDDCPLKYNCDALCIHCGGKMKSSAIVRTTSSGNHITCWMLCSINCLKEFPMYKREKKITGWCDSCCANILEVKTSTEMLTEMCFVCRRTDPIIICPRCKFAKYCSEDCRLIDWRRHSPCCL